MNASEFVTLPRAQFDQLINAITEKSQSDNDLLSTKEAAAYLKISMVTFWRIRRSAGIKSVSVGQKMFFRKSALNDYLNRKEVVNA